MKRLLLIVPFVLLLLLNACGSDPPTSAASSGAWTAIIGSQTATMWTITPTQTNNPYVPAMVSWLNIDLLSSNSLGSTIDAQYIVNNITFPNLPNSSSPEFIFRIEVGCSCMNTGDCCTPERTFITIVETMKKFSTSFPPIPPGVTQMMVVCSNQQTKSQIGAIVASWQNVSSYLWGPLDGHQLGVQITRTMAPTP